MDRVDFTLITDGSSDAILIYPISWLIRKHLCPAVNGTWSDLRRLPHPPRGLSERITAAVDLYPCDLVFVHRDAEGHDPRRRIIEIEEAVSDMTGKVIPVVPVRMQDAWLLIDEAALRRAAGNPQGRAALRLPPVDRLESLPDPKQTLHHLLIDASELSGRRRRKLNPGQLLLRLGELIDDYSPLRRLPAFRHLEAEICAFAARAEGPSGASRSSY